MSSDSDPVRLAAQAGTTPWLQSALSSARQQTPGAEDVERLTLRVEAAIAAGLPGPDITGPANVAAGSVTAGKIAIAGLGLVIGVAVGTVWTMKHTPRKLSEPTAVSASVAPVMSSSLAPSAPALDASAAPAELASKPAPAPTTNDVRNSGLSEAALLDAARSSLQGDPRRALSLTREHARRFPTSLLAQEREVIAIEALNRLGHTAAAKARAENFTRMYPGSAHQQKIDQSVRGK